MESITLSLWQEEFVLGETFMEIVEAGAEHVILKELGRAILYQRSFNDYQIEEPNPQNIDTILEKLRQQLKLEAPEAFEKWLKSTNQTEAILRKKLGYQERIRQLKHMVITEDMIKDAFLKRKPKLDRTIFGLIRVDDEALANEIYYRLHDDHQDFAALALQYSVGPEAADGGIVGPKIVSELNQELRKILLDCKPTEITEPFTLDGKQYLIARMLRLDTAQLNPGLENALRDELFEQWVERQLSLAEIQVNEKRLKWVSRDSSR